MKFIKNTVKRIPILYDFILKRKLYSKHRPVINLLNNQSVALSTQKSIIHFSINKAATQHVKNVLKQLSQKNNLIHIDFNGYAFASKLPYLDLLSETEMERYNHIFKPKGYLYSVFGGMVKNIHHLDSYNIILSIRDPRDILVSKYYSIAYSHAVPHHTGNKRSYFLEKREQAQKSRIDAFVRSECRIVKSVFQTYKNELVEKHRNTGIIRYESMISDYEEWLTALAQKAGLSLTTTLKKNLLLEFEQTQGKKEDINRHLRKGVSGDYREKLTPETISILNEELEELLVFFGYSN